VATIVDTTNSYERWLRRQLDVVARDLKVKHAAMAEAPFPFLRATFYHWMQLWPQHAGALADAPQVLAVGDLHVENFGTWRDAEGRLVWGVNDFDEAYPLPFTLDLVRLATSAHLAIEESHLSVRTRDSCDAILGGYFQGLESGGRPFVLAEHNTWLWRLATNELRNPKQFWEDQDAKCTPLRRSPPPALVRAVMRAFPDSIGTLRVSHRTAGKGSLGRPRILFRTEWDGATTAREAKALAPSACAWAEGASASRLHYRDILTRAVRAPDPFVELRPPWLIRRIAADCSKIDLAHLPSDRDETKLLWAMGFELANIHLGTAGARKRILAYRKSLEPKWLHRASKQMAEAVAADWMVWRRRTGRG
jgi:hypothetical protein